MATINDAVRLMYLNQTGREADPGGLEYFTNRFGADSKIDDDELAIFRQMASAEVAGQEARQAAAETAQRATTYTPAQITDAINVSRQQGFSDADIATGLGRFLPNAAAVTSALAANQGQQMPTQEILKQMTRDSNDQRLKREQEEEYERETQSIAKQMASEEAFYAAQQAARQRLAQTGETGTTAGMSITQAYQRVLGRTPSAEEIAYWTSQFGADVDAAELSKFSVAAQPERAAAPTTNAAIRNLYLSVLGREADASGLKYFSDRFGAEVDADELGIFKGMAAQEIAANAARTGATTGTTTGAVQPITRPTAPRQVTGTQLAPASVTNTAITGTPYTNAYTPATMQQNAPTLAQINAASQSANPYQSLMALTPQRTISPAYSGMLGQTAANTNLGGYNPAIYNPAATTAAATGLLNTTGGGNDGGMGGAGNNTGGGMAGINNQAALSATLSNMGFTSLGQALATSVGNQLGSLTQSDILGGGTSSGGDTSGFGGAGNGPAGIGGDFGLYAKGGMVNMNPQMHNPPGPDDGYAALDNGEYVIKKSAVKKYGSNIFEQINAGRIPAQRLKSLLE